MIQSLRSRPMLLAAALAVAVNAHMLGVTATWGFQIKEYSDCRYVAGNLCPGSTTCRNLVSAAMCWGEGMHNPYLSWNEQTWPIWQCFKLTNKCCVSDDNPNEEVCARKHYYAQNNCASEIAACYQNTTHEECSLTIDAGNPECDL